jgi:F-type H+-transporting ATPase subunit epsilon
MAGFNLRVLTPKREVFSGEVEGFTAPGIDGDFGVLAGHYAYITSVKPGALSFSAGGKKHLYAVGSGFAQVSADRVSLVLSSAEDASNLNVADAKAALAKAEEALLTATPGEPAYNEAIFDQEMALGRLAAAERR